MIKKRSLVVQPLHLEAEPMSSPLGRNAIRINIINCALDNHASLKLLVKAHENVTKQGGHADGYESGDAIDTHSDNVPRRTRGIHYVFKKLC